jgi:RNA polymerase sigma factor (sigma-70 family)
MPPPTPARFLAGLRSTLASAPADAWLVSRFVRSGDESAFAELVARHGPMVLTVCRRTAGDDHLAEDAFQATFLVLARKAAAVCPRGDVGAFLHGVAYRTALRARVMASHRRAREIPVPTLPDPADDDPCPAHSEALRALDEEVARLPDHLRAAVVLVELEGRPRKAVAGSLGIPEGTLSSRLAKARRVLADRLRRRGFALPATVLVAAAVPPGLATAAARLAGPGAIPPGVAALAAGVLRVMFVARLKLFALTALALVASAVALAAAARSSAPGPLLAEAGLLAPLAAPTPRQKPPETFLVQNPGLVWLGADGQEKERLVPSATNGALSPHGRWLAGVEFDKNPARVKVVLRPRGRKAEPVTVPLVWDVPGISSGCQLVWAADSRRLIIGENRRGQDGALEYTYRTYELATKKTTELKLPAGHWVAGWSRDGKRLLTTAGLADDTLRIAWVNADATGRPEFLTSETETAYDPRLSPDGRRMLYLAAPRAAAGRRSQARLYVMDLASRKRMVVDEPGETHGYCWSPDGIRVAYTWQRSLARPKDAVERETFLITCDRDGRNRKTVTSRKYKPVNPGSGVVLFFWVLDWR